MDGKKLMEFQEGNLAECTHNSSGLGNSTKGIESMNTPTVTINNSDNPKVSVCPLSTSTVTITINDSDNANVNICRPNNTTVTINMINSDNSKACVSPSSEALRAELIREIMEFREGTYNSSGLGDSTVEIEANNEGYAEAVTINIINQDNKRVVVCPPDFATVTINIINSDGAYGCVCPRSLITESCDPFNTEPVQISKDKLFLYSGNTDNTNQSLNALTEIQSKTSVDPFQLKSRLGDLLRISMNVLDRDGITVRNGKVNNVDAVCPYKNKEKRNANIFSMCCSIQ